MPWQNSTRVFGRYAALLVAYLGGLLWVVAFEICLYKLEAECHESQGEDDREDQPEHEVVGDHHSQKNAKSAT